MPTPKTQSAFTPADAATPTPGEASAFITTTVQLPLSTSHSRVCTPAPSAVATQKLSPSGWPGRRAALDEPVGGPEGGEVHLGELGVLDAVEVPLDVVLVADAHEDRDLAARIDGDPQGGQVARGRSAGHPRRVRSPRSMSSDAIA